MRAGTVLHNSPKPFRAWLLAMFHMAVNKQSVSALRLQRLLGFGSYDTAARWLRELRRVLAAAEHSEKLGPEVEVDEKTVGGVEKGGRGTAGKTWIIGAVERKGRGCGRARLRLLSNRSNEEFKGFVSDFVEKGSIVATDGHKSYLSLGDLQFVHDPRTLTKKGGGLYNQLKMEDGREKVTIHLPNIHKVFSLVERVVLGAFQGSFSERHLQGYLDEYCFRFNRRHAANPVSIFHQIAVRAVERQSVPFWRSRGREAPDKPTRKANSEWGRLSAALQGGVSLG